MIEEISNATGKGRMFHHLDLIYEHPYVILRLNRENDQLNTLDMEICREIYDALEIIWDDEKVKALIVTGNDRVFSTGADLRSLHNISPYEARHLARRGKEAIGRLEDLNIPTIAAINGLCIGGGLELSLCCDFRIASTKACFSQGEVNIGIIPGWGGCLRLPRVIGQANALKMIFSGEMINAKDALELGLIQKIIPTEEDIVEAAKEYARPFVNRSRISLMFAKRAVKTGLEIPLKYAYDIESELFGFAWASEDRVEGMESFLKKEKPKWKDK